MKLVRYILIAVISAVVGAVAAGYWVYERVYEQYTSYAVSEAIHRLSRSVHIANRLDAGEAASIRRDSDVGLCSVAHIANQYRHRGLQSGEADYLFDLVAKRRQLLLARETPATFPAYEALVNCDMEKTFGADIDEWIAAQDSG